MGNTQRYLTSVIAILVVVMDSHFTDHFNILGVRKHVDSYDSINNINNFA